MNKIEIKEYLQKIYGVRVTRVNTSNMLGIHTPHHTSYHRKGLSIHQNHHQERTRLEEGIRIHRSQLSSHQHHNARSQGTVDEGLNTLLIPFLFHSTNNHNMLIPLHNTLSAYEQEPRFPPGNRSWSDESSSSSNSCDPFPDLGDENSSTPSCLFNITIPL